MSTNVARPIVLRTQQTLASDWHGYRLASQDVLIDKAFDGLCAYAKPCVFTPETSKDGFESGDKTVFYQGEVFALGEMYAVAAAENSDWLFSDFATADPETVIKIAVSKSGEDSQIVQHNVDEAGLLELALGPMLITCLAIKNTFCLHASAAEADGKTCLFLGDSGVGKSTLAAHANDHDGWRYIADDIVPVGLNEDAFSLLPHLPQLKKSAEHQYLASSPERVAPDRVFILQRDDDLVTPRAERISEADKLLALVRHTACARLFAHAQKRAQMMFMKRLAQSVAIERLRFSHAGSPEELKTLVANLAQDSSYNGESS